MKHSIKRKKTEEIGLNINRCEGENKMSLKVYPANHEKHFLENEKIVSKTDTEGRITYGNGVLE